MLDNGLRAAWSVPIFSGAHEVLGTFALYYREPRTPCPEDVALLEVASRLAAVAIEQRDLTDRLAHQAHHDALTGLPNRALFEDRLAMAVAHAHRQDRQLAVLFLDLDQFKIINDSLGHGLGDQLLQAVAERLQAAVREGDTVARQGGDEFILLLPWISGAVDAAKVAQKVLETVRLPFRLEGHDLFVTTSIGVSLYPDDGDGVEALIKNSDSALYRAKERGRDGVQLYAPAMNAQAAERLGLESSLRRALPLGQFELHYQPVVSGAAARVAGVEALLRWRHPERGLLVPADFIGLAEITGLIAQIGLWALRTACAQVKAWHDAGHPGLTLVGERLVPPVPGRRPGRAGGGGPPRDEPGAVAARARDHRDGRDAARRGHRQHAAPAARAGRARRHRRLRHRLLVARLPAALPARHRQDRPLVRARDPPRPGGGGHLARGDRDGAHAAPARGRGGRRERGPARLPAGERLREHAGLPVRPAGAAGRVRGLAAAAAGRRRTRCRLRSSLPGPARPTERTRAQSG